MNNQSKNAIDIVLAESLKALATTKPIEKITIKDITDKAGVIRPTFYNHFQDKYELLEWIVVNDLFVPTDPLFSHGMLKEGITYILNIMEKERDFYKKAVQLEGQNSFNEILTRCVTESIIKHINLEPKGTNGVYKWLNGEMVADFYANAVCYGITKWIKQGNPAPVDQMVEVMLCICQNAMVDVIKELT